MKDSGSTERNTAMECICMPTGTVTKESGETGKRVVTAPSNIKVELDLTENSRKTRPTAMESCSTPTVIDMMVVGSTAKSTDREPMCMLTAPNIKVIGRMTNKMEGGYSTSPTVTDMRVISKMVRELVVVYITTPLEISMKVSTELIRGMVKASYCYLTVINTKEVNLNNN